ncbi:hypothetical protein [Maribacter flavus]|uniref:Uncharacterized protein n=1 Tax=Maribacter flavus TaxID=1658664 RepID=A0A5B2TQE1_9FLAO|nr:hypothetical protein [Maribacter flavus]KAA2215760.1 hypothetical protein F0361_16325 [Maribacter flavus]
MKNSLLLMMLILQYPLLSQIPVTDAATNGSLGLVNSQLIQNNIQLKAMNKNLLRLIQLMEKNNRITTNSKDILQEELEAKKKTPSYVLQSSDVSQNLNLKSQIMDTYRILRQTVQQYDYLTSKEKQEFLRFVTEVILTTKNLFTQGQHTLTTPSLLPPGERLNKIRNINADLEVLLKKLQEYGDRLAQRNALRKSKRSIIQLNEPQ